MEYLWLEFQQIFSDLKKDAKKQSKKFGRQIYVAPNKHYPWIYVLKTGKLLKSFAFQIHGLAILAHINKQEKLSSAQKKFLTKEILKTGLDFIPSEIYKTNKSNPPVSLLGIATLDLGQYIPYPPSYA